MSSENVGVCWNGPLHGNVRAAKGEEFLVAVKTRIYATKEDWSWPDDVPFESHKYVWNQDHRLWVWMNDRTYTSATRE